MALWGTGPERAAVPGTAWPTPRGRLASGSGPQEGTPEKRTPKKGERDRRDHAAPGVERSGLSSVCPVLFSVSGTAARGTLGLTAGAGVAWGQQEPGLAVRLLVLVGL